MKRFVSAVILVCALCSLTPASDSNFAPFAPQFAASVEQQVVQLPQDADKWYLTLIVVREHRTTPILRQWFENEPTSKDESGTAHLSKLRSQCHYHVYFTDETIYKDRYAPYVKSAPTVLLQRADGTTVFRASWPDMPITPEALYNGIRVKIVAAQAADSQALLTPAAPAAMPAAPNPPPLKLPADDLAHSGAPTVETPQPQVGSLAIGGISLLLTLLGVGSGGSVVTLLLPILFKYLTGSKLDSMLGQYVASKAKVDTHAATLTDELAKAEAVVVKIKQLLTAAG